ncbi:MAG: hypothetical protein WD534_13410 [Phycisphaeraceae bacterium]
MKQVCMWLAAVALMLAGCAAPPAGGGAQGYPPDFAMIFTVEHDAAEAEAGADPLARPAQHLVLPDRTLRVALGPGATHDYYPQVTARLTPAQMRELYRLVRAGELLEPVDESVELEPGVVPGVDPGALRYRLSITVHGYRREYVTTPEQRPGAVLVLQRLVALRGGR